MLNSGNIKKRRVPVTKREEKKKKKKKQKISFKQLPCKRFSMKIKPMLYIQCIHADRGYIQFYRVGVDRSQRYGSRISIVSTLTTQYGYSHQSSQKKREKKNSSPYSNIYMFISTCVFIVFLTFLFLFSLSPPPATFSFPLCHSYIFVKWLCAQKSVVYGFLIICILMMDDCDWLWLCLLAVSFISPYTDRSHLCAVCVCVRPREKCMCV